jgi:hypothetical protein
MFWQFKNDPKGEICKTVLAKAGINFHDYNKTKPDTTPNKTTPNNTKPNNTNPPTPKPKPKPKPTPIPTPTPGPSPNYDIKPAPGASNVLSMFYCGFGGDYCGQSNTDDVNDKASIIIMAFVNTQSGGSVKMDEKNYPTSLVNKWKSRGKKVIISVGGQNGHWQYVFVDSNSVNNFVNSIYNLLTKYNFDGVDIDI